jgi:PBP1b-binding outer membrane lipoprotein LpoB
MKKLVPLVAIVITVLLAGGCEKPRTTSSVTDNAPQTPDHKTVQTVETNPSDFGDLMTKWEHEHWKVLSTSGLSTQADGTMTRTVELAR